MMDAHALARELLARLEISQRQFPDDFRLLGLHRCLSCSEAVDTITTPITIFRRGRAIGIGHQCERCCNAGRPPLLDPTFGFQNAAELHQYLRDCGDWIDAAQSKTFSGAPFVRRVLAREWTDGIPDEAGVLVERHDDGVVSTPLPFQVQWRSSEEFAFKPDKDLPLLRMMIGPARAKRLDVLTVGGVAVAVIDVPQVTHSAPEARQ